VTTILYSHTSPSIFFEPFLRTLNIIHRARDFRTFFRHISDVLSDDFVDDFKDVLETVLTSNVRRKLIKIAHRYHNIKSPVVVDLESHVEWP